VPGYLAAAPRSELFGPSDATHAANFLNPTQTDDGLLALSAPRHRARRHSDFAACRFARNLSHRLRILDELEPTTERGEHEWQ
jgi:hypothetical protein